MTQGVGGADAQAERRQQESENNSAVASVHLIVTPRLHLLQATHKIRRWKCKSKIMMEGNSFYPFSVLPDI